MIKRTWMVAACALLAGGAMAAAKAPVKASAASPVWVQTWGASPLQPTLVAAPFAPVSPSFNDVTLRQVVRISAGGRKVRIRISNEYGAAPLHIGAAHVALSAGPGGAIAPGSDHVLTFSGHPGATIPSGAPLLSDPVDMAVGPLASLAVSLYLPGDSGPCTCHQVGLNTGYVSAPGDFTGEASFPTDKTILYRAFLMGVDVQGPVSRSVVMLGDSLTDGAVSTPDTNSRWPDRLAERLHGSWGIVNEGISGNRLLADGAGVSALARFDRDVLSASGVKAVVVMLATNDLGVGYGPANPNRAPPQAVPPPTAEDLMAGYRQLIDRAHAHGIKVYATTVMPYEGASYWSPQGDAVREAVNAWVRKGGAFDGYVDFDAVWRDPAQPARIKDGYHAPDHLHGTDAGYHALGDAVPLAWFR
jgi:lysophospholipase L1-like esterase